MKKFINILFFLLLFFYKSSLCQPTYCSYIKECNITPPDSLTTYLTFLDLNAFVGTPVDSFIAKLPTNYSRMKLFGGDFPKIATRLIISYLPKNISISIYVHDFKYMNPRSETMTWDAALFRKENIDHIEIFKGSDCINGCPL